MSSLERPAPKKQYPKFYEKTIPIAIGILVIVIGIMLVITIGVALGIL